MPDYQLCCESKMKPSGVIFRLFLRNFLSLSQTYNFIHTCLISSTFKLKDYTFSFLESIEASKCVVPTKKISANTTNLPKIISVAEEIPPSFLGSVTNLSLLLLSSFHSSAAPRPSSRTLSTILRVRITLQIMNYCLVVVITTTQPQQNLICSWVCLAQK